VRATDPSLFFPFSVSVSRKREREKGREAFVLSFCSLEETLSLLPEREAL
jgi:hypothetical protein